MIAFCRDQSRVLRVALLLLSVPAAYASDVYTISNFVIAPGGTSQSSNGCFAISGAAGQPVVDSSSSANYDLDSGFWALLPTTEDSLFSNGFEDCSS